MPSINKRPLTLENEGQDSTYKRKGNNGTKIRGPKLFNALPANLKSPKEIKLQNCKRILDYYLSPIPDEPMVAVYHGRSMLD